MKTIALLLLGWTAAACAGEITRDATLQKLVDDAVNSTIVEFAPKKLASNQLAVTLVDLSGATPRSASFRGDARIYPASVVKLFYLVAAHQWMEDSKLKDSAELRRGMRDMIVDSSNDATHYVVDVLTGTTSGPELPDAEMKLWGEKRNAVNQYFVARGFSGVNANQKPWCEGPYGRERIWVGESYTNRNALTTDDTARLLAEIATGKSVSRERCREMMALLERKRDGEGSDSQGRHYTGLGLPAEAKLWSKAGWTSTARHDAAYVELPGGGRFVLVTFTTGHANERDVIAKITRKIVGAWNAASR